MVRTADAQDRKTAEEASGQRGAGCTWVVRRTFIEMIQDQDSDASSPNKADNGLYVRASSDPTLYKSDMFHGHSPASSYRSSSPRSCDGNDALDAATQADDNVQFEMTGFESDTETNPDKGRDGNLSCYRFMKDDKEEKENLPGQRAGGEGSKRGSAANSMVSAPPAIRTAGPVAGGAPVANGVKNLEALMRENERLALENQLLRENARLAKENTKMKEANLATSSSTRQPEAASDPASSASHAGYPAAVPPGARPGTAAAPQMMMQKPAPTRQKIRNEKVQAPQMAESWAAVTEASEEAAASRAQPAREPEPARRERLAPPPDRSSQLEPAFDGKKTTVMLRNLPNNYSRAMVIEMLDQEGFKRGYDFLYLPMDFKTRACLGYAFVNLVSAIDVPRFWANFNGFSKWALPSQKVCGVTWSGPHQGLEAHVERYRNSPVMHDSVPENYKPAIFKDGVRAAFPPPTKTTRAPRTRNYAGCKGGSNKGEKGGGGGDKH